MYAVESREKIGPVTGRATEPVCKLYIGHVDKVRYVSTVPNGSYSVNEQQNASFTEHNVLSEQEHANTRKRKHNSNLKNMGLSTTSSENDECKSRLVSRKKMDFLFKIL